MATKSELQDEARRLGVPFSSRTSADRLEAGIAHARGLLALEEVEEVLAKPVVPKDGFVRLLRKPESGANVIEDRGPATAVMGGPLNLCVCHGSPPHPRNRH